jgi:TolB-like protein
VFFRPACFFALLLLPLSGEASSPGEQQASAIISVRDRAADPATTARIATSLETLLLGTGPVIERNHVRATLRQLRIRQVDNASSESLTRLAEALKADWLLSVTVHESRSQPVPTITLSAMAVRGNLPQDSRSAFTSVTGIDGLHFLGLGEVWDIDRLADLALLDLLDQLDLTAEEALRPAESFSAGANWQAAIGRIAVLPLTSSRTIGASATADAATQALYSLLQKNEVDVVAPNRVAEVLRQQRTRTWGELSREVWTAIAEECQAKLILTGSVEAYDAGPGREPRPFVAVALRGVDAQSGRIVWTGALERDGWFRQTIFRGRRSHSRGELLTVLLSRLISDLADQETSLELTGAEP